MKKKKIAVVLFNLGGPDSKESIKPFLFNFFMDKRIIGALLPIRWVLAKMISIKRSKAEAGDSYKELGDRSPLLENTEKQAIALQSKLPDNFRVFISMRYWHPMSMEVIGQIKGWGAEEIIFLPLYPQLSTATTVSSMEDWARNSDLDIPSYSICCYPWEEGFIAAAADNIRCIYEKAAKENKTPPRLLLSAHGLPEVTIKRGDPYQWQCEKTAEAIIKALDIKELDWKICYQSRVGPLKWIGPSTEECIIDAAEQDVPVVIFPHAFTQEHVETLVELDIEYRHLAKEKGLEAYYCVPTVSTHERFIDGLVQMVLARAENKLPCAPNEGKRICPKNFKECVCQL